MFARETDLIDGATYLPNIGMKKLQLEELVNQLWYVPMFLASSATTWANSYWSRAAFVLPFKLVDKFITFCDFFNFPNYVRKHKLLYGGFSRTDNFFYFGAFPPFVIRLCCLMQVTNCYPTADPLIIIRRHIFINMHTLLHQKADLLGSVDYQLALSLLFMKVIQLLSTL